MKYPDDFIDKVICGDCLKVMKEIPNNSVDMIITSPPYNVGIDYGICKDNLEEIEYKKFIENFIKLSKRTLKSDGRLAVIVPGGIGRNPYIPLAYEIINFCKKYFALRGSIIWYKGLMHGKTAWGSWKSPSNPGLRDMSELIVVAHNKESKKIRKGKTDLTPHEFMIYSNDIWFISPDNKKEFHPATFPTELPSRLIKFYTYIDDIVLDCFMGIGTTCLAAKQLNRHFIGIEINPDYCKIARERLMGVPDSLFKESHE